LQAGETDCQPEAEDGLRILAGTKDKLILPGSRDICIVTRAREVQTHLVSKGIQIHPVTRGTRIPPGTRPIWDPARYVFRETFGSSQKQETLMFAMVLNSRISSWESWFIFNLQKK
jgi:hypothetical protein